MKTKIPAWQQAIRERCVHPSGSFTPFAEGEVERSVPERFEDQVRRHGGRIAVRTVAEQLSYEELNRAANRIAHGVLRAPASGSGLALHLFEQGAGAVAALLGILKSGRAYAPLDPRWPAARLSLIADESESDLVVTNGRNLALAREIAGERQILNIDAPDPGVADEDPERDIAPDELAWVIYTSGSTGRPKGVMQTHRNVLHSMMNYTAYFRICPEDRLSNLFSFSTHAGSFGLMMPLMNGAALLPLDLRQVGTGYLPGWLEENRVTVACMVPTVFRRFASELSILRPEAEGTSQSRHSGDGRFPELRLIYLAGEPLLRTDFELYRKHMPPGCLLVNRFGSTEMDCTRLFFADKETRIEAGSVPIGYHVRDKELTLIDEGGRPAERDQAGEIVIRSRYISTGYWRRPDLTEAAYSAEGEERVYRTGDLGRQSADGCVQHMGRKDFQAKIRGFRVEIAEVESALLELAEVRDGAVMAREGPGGAQQLVAWVAPRSEPGPTVSALRSALAEKLPEYMVPAAFVKLRELPYAPNGKVNRRGLPEPGAGRPELDSTYAAPRGEREERVAGIWEEVLGLVGIGANDEFFELGGDSIKAMQVLARLKQEFGVELSPGEALDCGTVRSMVEKVSG